jgi:hypothetical protein
MGTTWSAQPIARRSAGDFSFIQRAISPMVRPWRVGIGYRPTNERYAGSSVVPWTVAPSMGLGRSRTTTSLPSSAAASITWLMV